MEASTDTQARRGGDCGRAIHGGKAMAALGCSGERGGDGSGGERERRGGRGRAWGRAGGGIEEAGGCWRSYPPVVAGERVRRGRAPVPTRVGGTGKGGGRGRRAGSAGWARWQGRWLAGPFGPGGKGGFFFFPFFSFSFFYVLFYLIWAFKQFINLCHLHHNCLCHIWHCPNIFVSIFENFYC